jgi:hypothetical protein
MMNPEKVATADMAGRKRGRLSDNNTDKPTVTTPNTRDAKFTYWDAE